MKYYTQSTMTLELTKEEMNYFKKFASFLTEYADEINDDANTIWDIITIMEDMNGGECDKLILRDKYNINIKLKEN